MDLALTGRNWPVNGSSFLCIMVIMATKPPPKLSIQDQNEWLEYDPAARFINNLPFHKRNKCVSKQVLRQEVLKNVPRRPDPQQITKPVIRQK